MEGLKVFPFILFIVLALNYSDSGRVVSGQGVSALGAPRDFQPHRWLYGPRAPHYDVSQQVLGSQVDFGFMKFHFYFPTEFLRTLYILLRTNYPTDF